MISIDTRIAKAYLVAKRYVISKGYASEIDWQDTVSFNEIDEQKFLKEYSWVVLASGMSDKVVSKVFPRIQETFGQWRNLGVIAQDREEILKKCLTIFNNRAKVTAILSMSDHVNEYGIRHIKDSMLELGMEYLKAFPFIGKATCFHLAKNIGLNYAKPDRHLMRVSNSMGYVDPNDLCAAIANYVEDKVQVVDLVLWRYATLDKNYLNKIRRLTTIEAQA